jgi:hypothetical protein
MTSALPFVSDDLFSFTIRLITSLLRIEFVGFHYFPHWRRNNVPEHQLKLAGDPNSIFDELMRLFNLWQHEHMPR